MLQLTIFATEKLTIADFVCHVYVKEEDYDQRRQRGIEQDIVKKSAVKNAGLRLDFLTSSSESTA